MCRRRASSGDSFPELYNELETPVLARYPLLAEIKRRLFAAGARGVLMSGSGSTIFGLFDSEMMRSVAQQDLRATGWWCAAARALDRTEYRAALQLS
jgi:4-diphosphocytidyl-2-C-methyl-D-erythritol kinase